MSFFTNKPAPAPRRKRPPSIDELNKMVATNQVLTSGDEVVEILSAQGIDANDPRVRQRLRKAQRNVRKAQRNVRKVNKRLKKGWF